MGRNIKSGTILVLIIGLITVGVLLFLISITAGDPVECGEPPELTGGEVTCRQVEWTVEENPDVTIALNSTLACGSRWSVDRWSHSCRISGNASAHSEEGDCRVITGQHTEVRIDSPGTHLFIAPYPKHSDYFGGCSSPAYGMVIREMVRDASQNVQWEWAFTNPFATATGASHYARWDFHIPFDSSGQATVTDVIETNRGEDIGLTWNLTIDALPDPKELSDEELALYGITKFSGGSGYATTGAIHVTPEDGDMLPDYR